MFKYLSKEKRTVSLLAADMVVLVGVIFFNWNPARMVGFYYLDICLCILSFVIYNFIIKNVSSISVVLMATCLILFLMYFAFLGLTGISNQLGFGNYHNNPIELFSPYYDFALFMTFSAIGHAYNIRKYISYPPVVAKPAFALFLGLSIFMIPGLFIFTVLLNQTHLPLNISILLSFIILRHYTEYRRYRSFIEIEAESKVQPTL
jgi:hypothetical protein